MYVWARGLYTVILLGSELIFVCSFLHCWGDARCVVPSGQSSFALSTITLPSHEAVLLTKSCVTSNNQYCLNGNAIIRHWDSADCFAHLHNIVLKSLQKE